MTDLTSLTTYSEWLDSQGLVVSDQGPDADKRTHSDLAAEFLAGCPMSEPTIQRDAAAVDDQQARMYAQNRAISAYARDARDAERQWLDLLHLMDQDLAARTADAAVRLAAVEAVMANGPETWEGYDSRDTGHVFAADLVLEFVTDLRAALSATAPDAGCTCIPGICSEDGECCESHDCPTPDAGQREESCDDCGHLASRHWLPGGCHGTQGSIARACRCARNSP